jgi:hypothetical protein
MNKNDKRYLAMKQWADQWQRTGKVLDSIKIQELRSIDTSRSIQNLSDAFESSLRMNPLRKSSGMVDMQFYFRKIKL